MMSDMVALSCVVDLACACFWGGFRVNSERYEHKHSIDIGLNYAVHIVG